MPRPPGLPAGMTSGRALFLENSLVPSEEGYVNTQQQEGSQPKQDLVHFHIVKLLLSAEDSFP